MSTRDKIIFETKKLFLENGIENVNTSEILNSSGVSNGTLFYYFKSKEKLALEIYQEIKDESENEFINDEMACMEFIEFLKEYWENNIKWIMDNPLEYKFIKTFNESTLVKEKYNVNKSTMLFLDKIDQAIEKEEITLNNRELVLKTFIHIRDSFIEYIFENELYEWDEFEKQSNDMLKRYIKFIK